MRNKLEDQKKIGEIDAILRALASIYTGAFLIDLETDRFSRVKATKATIIMLEGIDSAQQAINVAIEKTVSPDERNDMLSFVKLSTLPARMKRERSLDREYKGTLSGWVRGSFIEVERDEKGTLTKVLYAYQILDEEKRKKLEHIQALKDNYAAATYAEENYRAIHRLIKSGMWRMYCDENWEISRVEWSDEFREMVGYKNAEDFPDVLDSWRNLLHPDDYEIGYGAIEAAIKDPSGKTVYDCEYRLKTKGRGYRWFRATGDVSRKPDGTPYCCFGVFFDITAEKEHAQLEQQRNEALETANKALQAMDTLHKALESGSWTSTYDENGNLSSVKWSSAFRSLIGFDSEEEFPDDHWESWFRLMYPDDRDKIKEEYKKTLADTTGESTCNIEFRMRTKNQDYHWFEAFGRILRREDGSPDTFYGILMDINERKKTEEKLKQSILLAQKANAAKTDFLSRMSHDIRTPINGIVGLLEIDEARFEDQEFIRDSHKKMRISADHLLSLINDVLEMSKLEDREIVLNREFISLIDLTTEIVTIVIDRATEAGILWDYEKGKAEIPYPYIYGSPLHLRQIFLNIYSNCTKYTQPGGKITTIVDSLGDQDGICTYRWTISDTGRGMSPKFVKHIFDPFAQEEQDARSDYHGTGLGMAIVKKLIDKMNGTIEVTSQEGVGSTFVITIPFEIAQPPASAQLPASEEPDSIEGVSLLLVEDNELNAEIAEVMLGDAGAKITTVHNGKEAVDLFADSPAGTFDAILMDVMMPVMDGLTATRTIRALPREDARTIPIIAMTANAFQEDARRCMEAGMNAHLAKPVQTEKVVKMIAAYCRNV